jgi:hypothetical protein
VEFLRRRQFGIGGGLRPACGRASNQQHQKDETKPEPQPHLPDRISQMSPNVQGHNEKDRPRGRSNSSNAR